MKQSTIRVGLVGSGFIAKFHSLAYNNLSIMYNPSLPTVDRVRLFDVTSDLAEAGAAQLGWQEATEDWRNITRADDIDLVDIVAPNYAHAEIAIDAARHGKHIFCEKPLAHDVSSALRMVKAVHPSRVYSPSWVCIPYVARCRICQRTHRRWQNRSDSPLPFTIPTRLRSRSFLTNELAV